jgi:DeoR/GlpR family transcriptional regulator of sugar metabolism
MKRSEIRIFTKSGNPVRLIEETTIQLDGKKVPAWSVQRLDSDKRMLCPTNSLKLAAEVLDAEDAKAFNLQHGL